ncbi:MAG: M48 family metalloprotease [Betaproteobacteria bacterium]
MSKAVFRKLLVRLVVSALSLGLACGVTSARSEVASLARAEPSALPALGDPSSESLSPSTERKLGESIMRDIRRSQAGDEDLDVIAYLEALGRRLIDASKSGQDFEFFLVRDSSLNAFALPGGFIGVHAGLIAAAESESELAGVLAHEIGHVTQRHIARMLGKSRDAGIAQMVGLVLAALAARSNPQATPGLIALGQQMAQDQMLSFSRDAEREADRIGFDTLTRAGFDPHGMVSFFGRIQRASRVYESAAPAYLRTHPLTTERMSDMQARIRQERYKQWPDSLGFRLIRARMQALLDPSVDGLRRSAERFEFQIKEQSTLDLAAAWFGLASVREAQLRWHDAYQAAQLARDYLQHEGLNNDSAASTIERLQIQALAGQGNMQEAIARSEAALQQFARQKRLVLAHAELLLRAQRQAEARRWVESMLSERQDDLRAWDLLSKIYASQGQRALTHRARAEVFWLQGALPAAIEQLKLAQSAKDADFFHASAIDARLREALQRWRAERAAMGPQAGRDTKP